MCCSTRARVGRGGGEMRIRTVKPEFWPHRMHQVLSEPAALLAVALLNLADDDGRFEASGPMIGARLFVYRALSKPIEDCLQELVRVGWIQLYMATLDGLEVRLGVVVNFRRHQVVNKYRPSTLPAPPEGMRQRTENGSPVSLPEHSRSATGDEDGMLPDDSRTTTVGRKEGREGKGKERKEGEPALSGSPSEPGEQRPEVPSVEEVVAFGSGPAGVPEDFCRSFHRKKTAGGGWFTRTGGLRNWGMDLVDWWANDRHRWQSKSKNAGGEDAAALEEQLRNTTDKKMRQELLRKISETRGNAR
jgi:hypothetical protein